MARLIYQTPGGEKKELRIGAKPVTVGRGTQVDLQVADDRVSRMHFGVSHKDGKYVLKDLRSTNGTLVNGQKTEGDYELKDGDTVKIGESTMVFKLDPTDPK
jgi:pSer/pThr/pTyr-binding forkhead associated (FHA) protein